MKCGHCGNRVKNLRRGICHTCYKNPEIRALQPSGATGGRAKNLREPTEDELEATIIRQLDRLPDWWGAETEAVRQADSLPWDKAERDGLAI